MKIIKNYINKIKIRNLLIDISNNKLDNIPKNISLLDKIEISDFNLIMKEVGSNLVIENYSDISKYIYDKIIKNKNWDLFSTIHYNYTSQLNDEQLDEILNDSYIPIYKHNLLQYNQNIDLLVKYYNILPTELLKFYYDQYFSIYNLYAYYKTDIDFDLVMIQEKISSMISADHDRFYLIDNTFIKNDEIEIEIDFYLKLKDILKGVIKNDNDNNLWNMYISKLPTEIIEQIYTKEEFLLLDNIQWHDIILKYVYDENIIKYIKMFQCCHNVEKLIELLDEFDCADIKNYNILLSIIRSQTPDISSSLLSKTNLSKIEQRELLLLSPHICNKNV